MPDKLQSWKKKISIFLMERHYYTLKEKNKRTGNVGDVSADYVTITNIYIFSN